jgi:hypothetical protein
MEPVEPGDNPTRAQSPSPGPLIGRCCAFHETQSSRRPLAGISRKGCTEEAVKRSSTPWPGKSDPGP